MVLSKGLVIVVSDPLPVSRVCSVVLFLFFLFIFLKLDPLYVCLFFIAAFSGSICGHTGDLIRVGDDGTRKDHPGTQK